MRKRAVQVALSVITLFVGLYLATVVGLWFHLPPDPRDSVTGIIEGIWSYSDFWGHGVTVARLMEVEPAREGRRVQVRYHPNWPSLTQTGDAPRPGCLLIGFGERVADTMELSTVQIGRCPPLPEPATTSDAPLMTPEEFIEAFGHFAKPRPLWEKPWEAWVRAAEKPVSWLRRPPG